MTRWLWVLIAAVVLIALAVFFWPTSKQTTTPPTAQAPEPQTAAQAPAPTAPTVPQTPAPAPQTAAQAPAPTAPTVPQTPAPAPQTAAQAPAPTAPTAPQTPAPAPQTAAQVPAPTAPTAPQTPAPAPQTTQPPAPAASAGVGEQAPDTVAHANEKAKNELASLKSGFEAKELIAALNDSVVNFASGSAEVPETMTAFLHIAADDLKRLPAGHVLEIAGYTDNTGTAEDNVALSLKRADAVRNALIKAGANPDMLVAKGYGSADPIASNDTPEGRLRNRRIEYHIVKTP